MGRKLAEWGGEQSLEKVALQREDGLWRGMAELGGVAETAMFSFGTKRPRVRIPPARPADGVRGVGVCVTATWTKLGLNFGSPQTECRAHHVSARRESIIARKRSRHPAVRRRRRSARVPGTGDQRMGLHGPASSNARFPVTPFISGKQKSEAFASLFERRKRF